MLHLKKGDKVVYLSTTYYRLGNGQEVEKEGDELLISSDVAVQKSFFKLLQEEKAKEEKVEVKEEIAKPANKKTNKK